MKRLFLTILVSVTMGIFLSGNVLSEQRALNSNDINAEPLPDNPRNYSVNIKFSKIDSVKVSTTIVAESLGKKRDSYVLPGKEWSYNFDKNILTIGRDIDNKDYIVRVTGKYITPLRIIPAEKIDYKKIRFVVNGRIGVYGKDYRYDSVKNEIELLSCTTGDEKYIVEYQYSNGAASIGSINVDDLNRKLLKYLDWPLEGNTVLTDTEGFCFSPLETKYKSVWMVQLIPAGDGYNGMSILKDFNWDRKNNKLTLIDPVDTKRFSVLILGEAEE
jgi:hypothetical protein